MEILANWIVLALMIWVSYAPVKRSREKDGRWTKGMALYAVFATIIVLYFLYLVSVETIIVIGSTKFFLLVMIAFFAVATLGILSEG